jgi:hypothetical protein
MGFEVIEIGRDTYSLVNEDITIRYTERYQKKNQLIFGIETPSFNWVSKFTPRRYTEGLTSDKIDDILGMIECSCYEFIYNEMVVLFRESLMKDIERYEEILKLSPEEIKLEFSDSYIKRNISDGKLEHKIKTYKETMALLVTI